MCLRSLRANDGVSCFVSLFSPWFLNKDKLPVLSAERSALTGMGGHMSSAGWVGVAGARISQRPYHDRLYPSL